MIKEMSEFFSSGHGEFERRQHATGERKHIETFIGGGVDTGYSMERSSYGYAQHL